ncbi:MAG: T9SS type A sorting domain-containing protein [bacterium]|nr:T9SS type A sorting domain-containing protein [bacterium]
MRNLRRITLLAHLILLFAFTVVSAQPCSTYSSHLHVSSVTALQSEGFEVVAMAVQGNTAAVLSKEESNENNGRLTFYDRGNPTQLMELDSFSISIPDYFDECGYRDLLFFEDHVYLFYGGHIWMQGGFDVYHWDSIGSLLHLGSESTQYLAAIERSGDRLYCLRMPIPDAPINVSIVTYDVGDPGAPLNLGPVSFGDLYGRFMGLAAAGSMVFASTSWGFLSLDMSTPSAPVELDLVAGGIPSLSGGVAIAGDIAWAGSSLGPLALEISDPSDIQVVFGGSAEFGDEEIKELGVHGDQLFATYGYSLGYRVFDISTPSSPVLSGMLGAWGDSPLTYTPECIYMADGNSGIPALMPVGSTPAAQRTTIDLPATLVQGLSAHGNLLIAGDAVIDVSDPDDAQQIGQLPSAPYTRHVEFAGDLAYATAGISGFHIYDLSQPENPVELGSLAGEFGKIAVAGDRAYVVSDNGYYLKILDIGDSTQPTILSTSGPFQSIRELAVHGDYLYVANEDSFDPELYPEGLLVYDVSNPVAPILAASMIIEDGVRAMALDWPDIYLGLHRDRDNFHVVSVTDPLNPWIRWSKTLPATTFTEFALMNGQLYAAGGSFGLCVVDNTHPFTGPVLVGSLSIPDGFLAVSESAIYFAKGPASHEVGVGWLNCVGMTGVEETAPGATVSLTTHPNPFNPKTTISFELSQESVVRLEVFDISGRRLSGLIAGRYPAGSHALTWTARNDAGQELASGVYLLRLGTDQGEFATNKVVLIR